MNSTKRWKPEEGQLFWFVDADGVVSVLMHAPGLPRGLKFTHDAWQFGNCFRTKKSAEKARRRISKLLKNKS